MGNLYQLLLHHAKKDPKMTEWLFKEYISPSIVNEIILLVDQALFQLLLMILGVCTLFGSNC